MPSPKNFASGHGYKVPNFARPLLSMMPSAHLKDQPPSFNTLAGPYNSTEYKSALKAIQEYSRAGRPLAMVYTRTMIYIAEDTSRELLAVDAPCFPSSPVQSPVLPGPSPAFALAPFVAPLLPRHHTFVDLLGSGASVIMIKPRSLAEVYNDRRAEILNLFQVLRSKGDALAQLLTLTPYQSGAPRENAAATHHDPIERARRTILRLGQIQNRAEWRTYQNALPGIVDRLRDLEVTSSPPADLLAIHDKPGAHFHLDILTGEPLPDLSGLRHATVSILTRDPVTLPYPSKVKPLPETDITLILADSRESFRKRTKETRLPKEVKPHDRQTTTTTPARNHPARNIVAQTRQSLDLSQDSFAALLGVPKNTLRNWERAQTLPPPARTLIKIARERPEVLKEIQFLN